MPVLILLNATLFFVGLIALFLVFERRFIFIPSRPLEVTPKAFRMEFEEVSLLTEDGVRVHGWFLPTAQSRFTILFHHGNAGNIAHRLDRVRLIQSHLAADVLLYDYRGYGLSEGSPSEEGTYRDAGAARRWLSEVRHVPPERLVSFGESLGSAVALETALGERSRALILESAFCSMPEMAQKVFPFLPLRHLVRSRYDNLAKVGRLRVPLLMLHGDCDEVVPFSQGRRVFDAAPSPKTFFAIPGAGHNDTYPVGGEGYWRAIAAFLDGLPPTPPGPVAN